MTNAPLPIQQIYLAQTLAEPAFGDSADELFYVRTADGKRSIVRHSLPSGLAEVLTTEPAPGGGIGYGGALFSVRGKTLVYASRDGRLHATDLSNGRQWPVTPRYEGVAAPSLSPCGRFVAFLAEQDGACNVLLTEAGGKALPAKLSDDPWYAFNPAFSPDGARIAWQEWDSENMPWDESRIVIASFSRSTRGCETIHRLFPLEKSSVAKPRISFASPQFSPGGNRLAFTSDESGWRSIWTARPDGSHAEKIESGEGEIGKPDWVPGLIPFRWAPDAQSIYAVRRHRSQDIILSIATKERKIRKLRTDWTEIDYLNVARGRLVFIGAATNSPPILATLETKSGKAIARASSGIGLVDTASLSEAEVLSWNGAGDSLAWGVLHRAAQGKGPRPLLVSIHGGPTSERALTWDPQAQYFATRGWHHLSVNHRGSSGYGRAYEDALLGRWGIVDVEDARSAAEHLVRAGLADPERLVITGGSAGGYTTLMALTRDPDFWAAGVSLYGIGNMYELMLGSHRFEVNYEKKLIGDLPESGRLWKERSPLEHASRVRAPILLFHGKDDKAVPHQQSVEFAEAVRRAGGIAELVSYEGEGHGFVREGTRRDVIERMEKFLNKFVMDLQR